MPRLRNGFLAVAVLMSLIATSPSSADSPRQELKRSPLSWFEDENHRLVLLNDGPATESLIEPPTPSAYDDGEIDITIQWWIEIAELDREKSNRLMREQSPLESSAALRTTSQSSIMPTLSGRQIAVNSRF